MSKRKIKKILSVGLLLVSHTVSAVEIPPAIFNPGTVEPGVVGRNLSSTPSPFNVSPTRGVTPRETEQAEISPEAKKIFFVLNKVLISGNTAFSNQELEAIFKPYLGRNISVAQLQELVQSISDKYQKAGYFLSKAILPPQEIKNGVVKVSIIEGFISEVKVQGVSRKALVSYLEKYGVNIRSSKPIKLSDLERYLLLINDVPGFTVKSVLAPDPKVPLGSTLTLVTEYKPIDLSVTHDNFQTRYLGPQETALFASANSLLIPGGTTYTHILSGNDRRKLQYYEIRHDQTLGTDGWLLTLDGYSTRTNPQFILTPLEIFGKSDDANAVLAYPLIRSRERNLKAIGQLDYMDNSSTALGEQLYVDHIRDATLGLIYNDTLWKGEDNLNISLNKGFNILNADAPGFRSRLGANMDYFRAMGSISRNQLLFDRFSLFALVTGQYANSILPAAQTFIFGGPYLGRGYDWAQFTGDNGIAGKVEFRVNTSFEKLPVLKQIQWYAFYDAGKVWSLIPNVPSLSGASVGGGARTAVIDHINAEVFAGKPLTTPNATQVILGKNGHAFLGYFQITAYL